jgi:hypothetical protein
MVANEMREPAIMHSRALWNRVADLASDEFVAQLLDRGEIDVWRVLYRLAREDPALHRRIKAVALTVPLPLPRLWLAALASLGEEVDLGADVPDYYSRTTV